jgi:cytidylate kinase
VSTDGGQPTRHAAGPVATAASGDVARLVQVAVDQTIDAEQGMAIVTVSHQLGSGGDDIARGVAEALGYDCVGAEILAEAAHTHGLAEDRLTRLGEAKPAFLDRLGSEAQTYIAVMQNAVLDAALQDNVVIIGRGGQWLLRGIPHVVRVRIMAPLEERVQRLTCRIVPPRDCRDGSRLGRHTIEQLIRRDDADKRGRMRYLYDRDLDDPFLYDVVFSHVGGNSGAVIEAMAILARRCTAATAAEGLQALLDRAVAGRVRVALMMDEHTRGYAHLDVEARHGMVHVTTRAPAVAVEPVTRSVSGVREVQVSEVPPLPPLPLG